MKEKNTFRFILILSALCMLNTFSWAQAYFPVNINQDPCTGVNYASTNVRKWQLRIVPNPNRGVFSLILSSNLPIHRSGSENSLVRLEIYNFQGKLLHETTLDLSHDRGGTSSPQAEVGATFPIDIAGVHEGIYLVKVLSARGIYNEKLIIE